ncbi:hypothetical protein A6S26_34720 [Nostoc sp. ATCC 43529]|nr:hypothetical protein A6S26_34720 [Nostoc sp. ATCC 43529]
MQTLPLELELAASQIAAQHYPHRRFKLIYEIKNNFIDIEFQGYYIEEFVGSRNRSRPSNPIHDFYRDKTADFKVAYGYGQLSISGWWRTAILTFDYNTKSWSNEDGEEITCPYPDGEKFEQIAAALYPLLQQHY